MSNKKEIHDEITKTLGLVPGWIAEMPDGAVGGFWGIAKDFWLAESKIPNKYKELIGVAVSGATRCKYCVLFHTEAAKLFGATDEEVAEASMMGAVTMFASTFINAQNTDYDKFQQETRDIIKHLKSSM